MCGLNFQLSLHSWTSRFLSRHESASLRMHPFPPPLPRPNLPHICRTWKAEKLNSTALLSKLSLFCQFLWGVCSDQIFIFSCPGSSIPDLGQWVTHSLTDCHFRILTQRVTFETSDPSDIWSEWCQDKKTKRQKDKRQKDKKTKRQRDKKKKRQKNKKTKRQKTKTNKRT